MGQNKLEALKHTNTVLSRRIKSLDYNLYGKNNYKTEMVYQSSNSETSLNILYIEKEQKSEIYLEKEFQRIVCIAGKIIIHLPHYDEELTLTSSNTLLIPPNTKYQIESIENSEIIVVFKPKKDSKETILIEETIYNKI